MKGKWHYKWLYIIQIIYNTETRYIYISFMYLIEGKRGDWWGEIYTHSWRGNFVGWTSTYFLTHSCLDISLLKKTLELIINLHTIWRRIVGWVLNIIFSSDIFLIMLLFERYHQKRQAILAATIMNRLIQIILPTKCMFFQVSSKTLRQLFDWSRILCENEERAAHSWRRGVVGWAGGAVSHAVGARPVPTSDRRNRLSVRLHLLHHRRRTHRHGSNIRGRGDPLRRNSCCDTKYHMHDAFLDDEVYRQGDSHPYALPRPALPDCWGSHGGAAPWM